MTLYTERYGRKDKADLHRSAMLGCYGQAENAEGTGTLDGKPSKVVIWRWLDEERGSRSTCYSILHQIENGPLVLAESGKEPRPIPVMDRAGRFAGRPSGETIDLNETARSCMAWIVNGRTTGEKHTAQYKPFTGAKPSSTRTGTRRLAHPIWIHPSVCDELREHGALYRRLGLLLEQLGATGRTAVTKHCRAPNRGWRRSPLGGDGKRQLYLWWTGADAAPAEGRKTPAQAVIVHAVREQGDNRKASVEGRIRVPGADRGQRHRRRHRRGTVDAGPDRRGGRKGERAGHSRTTGNREDDRPVARSREHQREVRALRNLVGGPGRDGKSTLRVLLLAGDRGGVHGLPNVGEPNQRPGRGGGAPGPQPQRTEQGPGENGLEQRPVGEVSRSAACGAAREAGRRGATGKRQHEYRHTGSDGSPRRRTCAARGGKAGIGNRAAREADAAARAIGTEGLAAVFPELAAATRAQLVLQDGRPDQSFGSVQYIVVDEIQDLTLLETGVITELALQIERQSGERPRVALAGDSGQRVRATGFEWSRLAGLLGSRLERPTRAQLDEHVRCPEKIAEVIERASGFYAGVKKERRPTRQLASSGRDHVEGQVIHVVAENEEEAAAVLGDALADRGHGVDDRREPAAHVAGREGGARNAAARDGQGARVPDDMPDRRGQKTWRPERPH